MEFTSKATIDIKAINSEFKHLYDQLLIDMTEVLRKHTNITSQYGDVVNPGPVEDVTPKEEEKKDGQA